MNLHSGGDELVGNPAIVTERSAVMAKKKKPQADFHRPNEIPPLGLQITLIEDTLGVLYARALSLALQDGPRQLVADITRGG